MKRKQRRLIKISLLAIALAGYAYIIRHCQLSLHDVSRLTGWVMFGLFVFLMLFNGIRKMPFFSFANARFWSQAHIYAGFFCFAAYFWHAGLHIPRGALSQVIAALFYLTCFSGIVGLILFRQVPKHLTRTGEEIIYERIPAFRAELQQRAEAIVKKAIDTEGSDTVSRFYFEKLHNFFSKRRSLISQIGGLHRTRYNLLLDIAGQARYLNHNERQYLNDLADLVQQKDNLDYHYALQGILKNWLSVHIPLAYSLLIFTIVHIITANALAGA